MGHNRLWGHLAAIRTSKYAGPMKLCPICSQLVRTFWWIRQGESLCYRQSVLRPSMASRGVTDIEHKVVAAGSRTAAKAEEFIKETNADQHNAKAYGSYEQVYADKARNFYRPILGSS
jgi:hypothetical protein